MYLDIIGLIALLLIGYAIGYHNGKIDGKKEPPPDETDFYENSG